MLLQIEQERLYLVGTSEIVDGTVNSIWDRGMVDETGYW